MITTTNEYIAAAKQRIRMIKIVNRTTVAAMPFSLFELNGSQSGGVLAGTNTANGGVVPTDATPGCPLIYFSSGTGYITRVEYGNTVAARQNLFDMLLKMGSISFGSATTTVSPDTQPVISQRCPDYPGSGNTFGVGNEIWLEVVTAFLTGSNWTVQVTYKNQLGVGGRTTIVSPGTTAANLTIGRFLQLQLQAGDTGVQRIESVIVANNATAMTAGTFNILILRPLITNIRTKVANDGGILDMFSTGAPVVYPDSALIQQIETDSNASGSPELLIEIANG